MTTRKKLETFADLAGYLAANDKALHQTECVALLEFAREVAKATIRAVIPEYDTPDFIHNGFNKAIEQAKDKAKKWLGEKEEKKP